MRTTRQRILSSLNFFCGEFSFQQTDRSWELNTLKAVWVIFCSLSNASSHSSSIKKWGIHYFKISLNRFPEVSVLSTISVCHINRAEQVDPMAEDRHDQKSNSWLQITKAGQKQTEQMIWWRLSSNRLKYRVNWREGNGMIKQKKWKSWLAGEKTGNSQG